MSIKIFQPNLSLLYTIYLLHHLRSFMCCQPYLCDQKGEPAPALLTPGFGNVKNLFQHLPPLPKKQPHPNQPCRTPQPFLLLHPYKTVTSTTMVSPKYATTATIAMPPKHVATVTSSIIVPQNANYVTGTVITSNAGTSFWSTTTTCLGPGPTR